MTEKMSDVKQLNYNALMVLQCLFENTDYIDHLSLKGIEAEIRRRYGYGPSHNTINKILKYLPDYGFDVRKGNRANPGFYLNSRYFSEGEILYFAELFKNSRSLRGEAKETVEAKLYRYLGPSFGEIKETKISDRRNKDLIKNIEQISKAIRSGRQLGFHVLGLKRNEKIWIMSNPYKIFERNGEIFLLYSVKDENTGDCRLQQIAVRAMMDLYIDPSYKIVPLIEAKNANMVDDELLMRVSSSKPDRYVDKELLVLLPKEEKQEKAFVNNRTYIDGRTYLIKKHFGKMNVHQINDGDEQYVYIKDIYGDGEEWFFKHCGEGIIIWPEQSVNHMRHKAEHLSEIYSKENIKKNTKRLHEVEKVVELLPALHDDNSNT